MKKMLLLCMMLSGINIAAMQAKDIATCCCLTSEAVRFCLREQEIKKMKFPKHEMKSQQKLQEDQKIIRCANGWTLTAVGCCVVGQPKLSAMVSCMGCVIDCFEYVDSSNK